MATNKTAHFGWQTPILEEEANVPADMKRLAEEIEAKVHLMNVEELGNAGAGDAGKLLLVGPGGVNAWKAMSGDATISSAGAVTVGAEKIGTTKMAALAVTEAILAGEAVGTAKIKALAVTAAKLAAECVEESKIKALAVSTAKLAELAVSTAKLANLCVTTEKIANGAITDEKLEKPWMLGGVTSAGGVAFGTFFNASRTGTGIYSVELKAELSSEGVMLPWCVEAGGFIYPAQRSSKKIWTVAIFNGKNAEVGQNNPFNFLIRRI